MGGEGRRMDSWRLRIRYRRRQHFFCSNDFDAKLIGSSVSNTPTAIGDFGNAMSDASSTKGRRRQAHPKSRNGCAHCKTMHRKCDEVHPTCGGCRQHGVTCSFTSPSKSCGHTECPLAIADLLLLHQWLKGDDGLSEDHNGQTKKRENDHQMDLAFAHPYLLHTILSLAALRLFHKEPHNTAYYAQASSHNLAALQYARPNITQSSREHSEPLFLFSAFTSLYAFAEPPLRMLSSGHLPAADVIGDLLVSFRMGRGILAITASNKDYLKEATNRNDELWPDETAEVMSTLEADFPQLLRLLELVGHHCKEEHKRGILEAVTRLFAIMSLLQRRSVTDSSMRLIQTWHMHADPALSTLWEARDPIGMVILAYYAVLVNLRSNVWFFARWPPLILDAVQTSLGSEWQEHLIWPRNEIAKKPVDPQKMDT
ncbi:hypothetical protein LTR10_009403 [Elasticomyces elasticus]|nr:hypothetical protein LTR10_009403 [Elasticomyces elasticus]KAK4971498.1 hypothetical protein LTR42_007226 [Elasticomyces elasticus]